MKYSNERYLDKNKKNKKDEENDSKIELKIPKKSLDELILPKEVTEQIKNVLTKIEYSDLIYNQFNIKALDKTGGRTSINFYGPPGTGKSHAAEGIAKKLNKKIIYVNYPELESKYVGETPKNLKSIFSEAKDKDAIIFFDEADSILGKRLSDVNKSTDHAVNLTKSVMLIELDNFSGITIFASNFGKNYDSAFLRRILEHVEFKLPDIEGRNVILKNIIPDELPVDLSASELQYVAEITEGFSGSDLTNLVINSTVIAVRELGSQAQVKYNHFLDAINKITKSKEKLAK